MKVTFSPRAVRDLEQIGAYYRTVADPKIADAVSLGIEHAITRIADQPQNAPRVAARPDARVVWASRYPYKIFYRLRDVAIEILHIRHTSRAPWDGISN